MAGVSASSAFERLHPSLKEALYRMRWTSLRPIQVESIHETLDGTGDIIVAARTAAGKTEAAFLPILSSILQTTATGIRAIYIGPLKALINDQFSRLEELCHEAEIPVHKWHGDVSATPKRKLLEKPSGILLITPESIESLFVNHPQRLGIVFQNLSFLVIDELHSFVGTERGAHLRSLTCRLAKKSRVSARRTGLSATLGAEIEGVKRWLRPTEPDSVRVIEDLEKKSIQLRIFGYLQSSCPRKPASEGLKEGIPPGLGGRNSKPRVAGVGTPPPEVRVLDPTSSNLQNRKPHPLKDEHEDEDEDATRLAHDLLTDIFEAFHGKTALIFANRKSDIEAMADFASRESDRRALRNLFRVHHGSLSKGEREETEEALKSETPTATFCSSTLEMGINVGNVKLVGQVGTPWSVSSLTQRLGRSGRREGEASIIRLYIQEDEIDENSSLFDRLFLELLQAIAMTELMLEKWCEPPESDLLHLSTLVQQILSIITERGGANAKQLHETLVTDGGFSNIDQHTFIRVLRCMGAADLIEQSSDGTIITGLRGESIVRSHDFYVAFVVNEEYRVSHSGHHVGNIAADTTPQTDDYLILAGRRWKILEIDQERKSIEVRPAPGGRVPSFHSHQGKDIHPRVRLMMRSLLGRTDLQIYLDPQARDMIVQARATARDSGFLQNTFLQDGPDTVWFTWTGSRIQRTLGALGQFFGGLKVEDEGVALVFEKATVLHVQETYRRLLAECPQPVDLAVQFASRVQEKYELYLSDELTAEIFARERLDLPGAKALISASCCHETAHHQPRTTARHDTVP